MVKLKKMGTLLYKSCLKTDFAVNDELTVLIGPNGSGKTNILTAIYAIKNPDPIQLIKEVRDEKPAKALISAIFDVDGIPVELVTTPIFPTGAKQLSIQNSWHFESFPRDIYLSFPLVLLNDDITPQDIEARNKEKLAGIKPSHDEWEIILKAMLEIRTYINDILYVPVSRFADSTKVPESFTPIDTRMVHSMGGTFTYHNFFLQDLFFVYNNFPEKYHRYINIICSEGLCLIDELNLYAFDLSNGKNFQIDISEIEEKAGITILPRVKIGNNILLFNQLSEGTFRIMALLFYVICHDNALILFEEPETGIHHGLLSSIIEIVKNESKNKQIIFSTHSDLILDKLEPDNLVFVTNGKEGTRAKNLTSALSKADKNALRVYLEDEGNLGQYWKEGGFEDEKIFLQIPKKSIRPKNIYTN